MGSIGKVMNVITRLFLERLSGEKLLTRRSNFTSAIKLTYGRNRFGKRTLYKIQTRIHF